MMWIGEYWWLVIPGLLLGLYAQARLSSVYGKYMRVGAGAGVTGAQAARMVLDSEGLTGVPVQEVAGHLTDHYDPIRKALFLSRENYHGRSVAALGVSAHEAGHALQHKASYFPLKFRMLIVPATQFASAAYMPLLLIGMFLGMFQTILSIVIALFVVIVVFQVVTLPVEYDASRRAKNQLVRLGLVQGSEAVGVNRVLNAAALTYVAALVTAVFQLLRLVLLARSND